LDREYEEKLNSNIGLQMFNKNAVGAVGAVVAISWLREYE